MDGDGRPLSKERLNKPRRITLDLTNVSAERDNIDRVDNESVRFKSCC